MPILQQKNNRTTRNRNGIGKLKYRYKRYIALGGTFVE